MIFGLPDRRQPVRFVYFSGVCFSLFGAVRPGVQILSSGSIAAAQVPFRFVLLQNEPHLFIQQPVDLPKTFGQILVHCAFGDAEALRRRLLKGMKLYQIDTLVDLINLVSLRTGYSIGGFDADKIVGTTLTLGIGRANEPFEGIGRGVLNIEGLPVYRDELGGIGTPTSDNERTKMGLETTHILAVINGYSGNEGLQEAAEMTLRLLERYASATEGEYILYP